MTDPTPLQAPDEAPPAPEATLGGRTREHWLILAVSVAGALGLAIIGLLQPDARGVGTHEQLGLPPCMTMELWNLPCPGCGVTTSVSLASRGRFGESLANQPFGLAVWLAAVAFVLWCWVQSARGRDLWLSLQTWNVARWVWTAGAIAGGSWIYKIALVHGA